jgi:hypothetical protein
MSNDGFRVVLDRRGSLFYCSFTAAGEEHQSPRGYPTITEAADEADTYRRHLDLVRHLIGGGRRPTRYCEIACSVPCFPVQQWLRVVAGCTPAA